MDSVSEIAKRIGAVNTIVNRDGKLYGYNTDYYGMKALIERLELCLQDKKVLVLGTGGTSKTARVVAADMGASEVLTVSRRKTEEYIDYEEAVSLHADAEIIINTTILVYRKNVFLAIRLLLDKDVMTETRLIILVLF